MSRETAIGVFAMLTALVLGIVAFQSYCFDVWPKPSLTTDDPAISEWLQDENVIIHRRGFKRPLDNSTMYIQQGQRIEGVVGGTPASTRRWSSPSRLSSHRPD